MIAAFLDVSMKYESQNQLYGWPQKYFAFTIRSACLRTHFLFSGTDLQNHFLAHSSFSPSLTTSILFTSPPFYSESKQELCLWKGILWNKVLASFQRYLIMASSTCYPEPMLNKWMKNTDSRDVGGDEVVTASLDNSFINSTGKWSRETR